MMQLFWLLLPIAALSGWFIGRWGRWRKQRLVSGKLPEGYLQGLNYLLTEQQDKAIEVFTRMVEVDRDTAELHLALGSLFRGRGEVDRAIRIHQNLIARPTMTREQRAHALLELGLDYMKAGLLDRAEALFEQVQEVEAYAVDALQQLLVIYQQAKEWDKAIRVANQLDARLVPGMRPLIAQFYCELADQALARRDQQSAVRLLRRALSSDPACVRASIRQGQLDFERGNYRAALKSYQRVERQDPGFLPEVLEPIQACYRHLYSPEALIRELTRLAENHDGMEISIALASAISEEQGVQNASEHLVASLERTPSLTGLAKLVTLTIRMTDAHAKNDLEKIEHAIQELLAQYHTYECRRCGFVGRYLHWQCPSCRSWSTVKPSMV